jgi:hypothetical protein
MVLSYYTMLQSVAAILQMQFMVHVMLFHMLNVLYSYISTFQNMCAVPNIAISLGPQFCAFPVCCSEIFWITFRWFHFPLIIIGITFTFYTCYYFYCKFDYLLLLLLFYFIFVKNLLHMYRLCVCCICLIYNLKALHQCHTCTCTLRTLLHTRCVGMPVIHTT